MNLSLSIAIISMVAKSSLLTIIESYPEPTYSGNDVFRPSIKYVFKS